MLKASQRLSAPGALQWWHIRFKRICAAFVADRARLLPLHLAEAAVLATAAKSRRVGAPGPREATVDPSTARGGRRSAPQLAVANTLRVCEAKEVNEGWRAATSLEGLIATPGSANCDSGDVQRRRSGRRDDSESLKLEVE